MLISDNIDYVKLAVNCLRNYFTDKTDSTAACFLLGENFNIALLLEQIFLQYSSKELLYECYWLLTNFIQDLPEAHHSFLQPFTSSIFLEFYETHFKTENPYIKEHILLFINSLLRKDSQCRKALAEGSKMFHLILTQLKEKSNPRFLIVACLEAFGGFVQQKDENMDEALIHAAIVYFSGYLYCEDEGIYQSCLASITEISNYMGEETINIIIKQALLKILCCKWSLTSFNLINSVKLVGNLCSCENEHIIDTLLHLRIIEFLEKALSQDPFSKNIKRKICWAMGNLCAGTKEHIQAVINSTDIFALIIDSLSDTDYITKKEAIACIYIISDQKDIELLEILEQENIHEKLLQILNIDTDAYIIFTSLKCLDNLLYTEHLHKRNSLRSKFIFSGGITLLEKHLSLNIQADEDVYRICLELNSQIQNYENNCFN
jgi:hypothetical protein